MNFSLFRTPSRYINSEINSIYKKEPKEILIRSVLVFPDTYEVGMSHIGIRILYHIINSLPYASAERAFSPWIDYEDYLKRNSISLTSLESHTPLKEFDIVGFSLQYELSYTTVLNMLELGGIPVHAEERLNSRRHQPLLIAGGPCTINPHPMSRFIDVFLIGDGEEAILELYETVRKWKLHNRDDRKSLLIEIAKLKGFYVPIVHTREDIIKRRFIQNLDDVPYPVNPLIPYSRIVHDRIAVEVSRGCTMGCRFCQAGIIYRPLRMRSPDNVLKIIEQSLLNTGYEEVSLTSLNAGDYPYLLRVMKEFNRRYASSKISLSLPSLRVASVNKEILREISIVNKTGFTIAPEAATDRLRSIINKSFSEEDYERALTELFSEGWLNLKLYFMIGLPLERDEDIEAIPQMINKALKIAKRNTKRFVNISVTISPFNPKPHTPFQWYGRSSHDEMSRKLLYLKKALISKKIKFKGHNENMSLLEAVFARGDENLSDLIFQAWKSGCRLDAWTECFDFNKWQEAMDKARIDCHEYSQREFSPDSQLPWDNIDTGVAKSFLYREYRKALSAEKTADCAQICTACGLDCKSFDGKNENKNQDLGSFPNPNIENLSLRANRSNLIFLNEIATDPSGSCNHSKGKLFECLKGDLDSYEFNEKPRIIMNNNSYRARARFSKIGIMKYLSHHELMTTIMRGLRRAKIPINFSQGFHPSPLISFCTPLNVGVSGEREYFDMVVSAPFDINFCKDQLNLTLPMGIKISELAIVSKDEPSLNSFIKRYEYVISDAAGNFKGYERQSQGIIVKRDNKEIDISQCIEDIISIKDDEGRHMIKMILIDKDPIKVRLAEIVEALFNKSINEIDIKRTRLYGWKDCWMEPL